LTGYPKIRSAQALSKANQPTKERTSARAT